jgi:hypothetical protein
LPELDSQISYFLLLCRLLTLSYSLSAGPAT